MTYQVQLEIFAGPLDLLLHLIEQSKLDIYDIPIAIITEQFLSYLHTIELLNLEVAGDFIVMAATLMQIKARMLLPKPVTLDNREDVEDEEDPRKELVDRLMEYKRIKEASHLLRELEQEQMMFFARSGGVFTDQQLAPVSDPLKGLSIWDILDAFQTILISLTPSEENLSLPVEEISVKQVMEQILRSVTLTNGGMDFTEVFRDKRSRNSIITAFIALLELIRLHRVIAVQEAVFDRILLCLGPAEEVPM